MPFCTLPVEILLAKCRIATTSREPPSQRKTRGCAGTNPAWLQGARGPTRTGFPPQEGKVHVDVAIVIVAAGEAVRAKPPAQSTLAGRLSTPAEPTQSQRERDRRPGDENAHLWQLRA